MDTQTNLTKIDLYEGTLSALDLTNINEDAQYNILDMPIGGITNAQMALALDVNKRGAFLVGSVYMCTDSGTYTQGHFYKFEGNQWTDVTLDTTQVDSAMSSTSTNPVQNRVIKQYVDNADSAMQGNISSLQSSLGTTNGNVSNLQTRVGTAEGNISTLQTNLGTTNGNVSSLSTRVGNAENAISGKMDAFDPGYNLQMSSNTLTVKEASENIAGGVYFWQDGNDPTYWHLTTIDPVAEVELQSNATGDTAVIETRNAVTTENATGLTITI